MLSISQRRRKIKWTLYDIKLTRLCNLRAFIRYNAKVLHLKIIKYDHIINSSSEEQQQYPIDYLIILQVCMTLSNVQLQIIFFGYSITFWCSLFILRTPKNLKECKTSRFAYHQKIIYKKRICVNSFINKLNKRGPEIDP